MATKNILILAAIIIPTIAVASTGTFFAYDAYKQSQQLANVERTFGTGKSLHPELKELLDVLSATEKDITPEDATEVVTSTKSGETGDCKPASGRIEIIKSYFLKGNNSAQKSVLIAQRFIDAGYVLDKEKTTSYDLDPENFEQDISERLDQAVYEGKDRSVTFDDYKGVANIVLSKDQTKITIMASSRLSTYSETEGIILSANNDKCYTLDELPAPIFNKYELEDLRPGTRGTVSSPGYEYESLEDGHNG